MKKYHVMLIFSMIHPDGEHVLNELVTVKKFPEFNEPEIIEYLKSHKVDGIILRSPARMTKEILDYCQNVKAISGSGTGLDNIDVAYATKKGIPILHAPKINSQATAEHTVALLLAVMKKIPMLDQQTRTGNFATRDQTYTMELQGKTLGLVGFGSVAQKTAQILVHGFGMKAIAYVRQITDEKRQLANLYGLELTTSLEKVFSDSDAVSLHLPLTRETEKLIDYSLFNMMKKSAVLINTARGGIINEDDFVNALKNRIFAGAGIDVFTVEPPQKDHPFFYLNNVVVSPHMGGISGKAARDSTVVIAKNLIRVLNHENIPEIVNKQVLTE